MPTYYTVSVASMVARRKRAEAQVRAKYPTLIEGSSGWHRALSARMKRIAA